MKNALIDTSSIIYIQKAGYFDVLSKAIQLVQAPYYNALMMLNFLLFSQRIDDDSYRGYYSALENFARYSEAVWEFGEHIYTAIKLNKG